MYIVYSTLIQKPIQSPTYFSMLYVHTFVIVMSEKNLITRKFLTHEIISIGLMSELNILLV